MFIYYFYFYLNFDFSNKISSNPTYFKRINETSPRKTNTKQTYTIVFELEKIDNQEMYDANKDFSAHIYIDLKTTGNLGGE